MPFTIQHLEMLENIAQAAQAADEPDLLNDAFRMIYSTVLSEYEKDNTTTLLALDSTHWPRLLTILASVSSTVLVREYPSEKITSDEFCLGRILYTISAEHSNLKSQIQSSFGWLMNIFKRKVQKIEDQEDQEELQQMLESDDEIEFQNGIKMLSEKFKNKNLDWQNKYLQILHQVLPDHLNAIHQFTINELKDYPFNNFLVDLIKELNDCFIHSINKAGNHEAYENSIKELANYVASSAPVEFIPLFNQYCTNILSSGNKTAHSFAHTFFNKLAEKNAAYNMNQQEKVKPQSRRLKTQHGNMVQTSSSASDTQPYTPSTLTMYTLPIAINSPRMPDEIQKPVSDVNSQLKDFTEAINYLQDHSKKHHQNSAHWLTYESSLEDYIQYIKNNDFDEHLNLDAVYNILYRNDIDRKTSINFILEEIVKDNYCDEPRLSLRK